MRLRSHHRHRSPAGEKRLDLAPGDVPTPDDQASPACDDQADRVDGFRGSHGGRVMVDARMNVPNGPAPVAS